MKFPRSQIADLAQHLREGKAACKHDIGYLLPDILDDLLSAVPEEITLETIAEKFHMEHFESTRQEWFDRYAGR